MSFLKNLLSLTDIIMFAYIILATLLTSSSGFRLKSPEVSYCIDGTDTYFANLKLDIKPWPIHIESGATLSLDMGFDILQTLPVGTLLKYEFAIHTILGNIPLPCIPVRSFLK